MAKKLTNKEIMAQVAQLSEVEANAYGVSTDMQRVAAKYAAGDTKVAASFYQPFSALYNAFCGFLVKFGLVQLSKATYNDVYGPHHRNMIQGRPELGFVKIAKQGTGNHSAQFADNPAQGSLTTVVTADMPDVVALYAITVHNYESRRPISYEDVKTAFDNEYGVNDLFVKVRESLEDKITDDRNVTYDTKFTAVASDLIAAGTGAELEANAARATYVDVSGSADWSTILANRDFSSLTEDQLVQVFIAIKRLFYGMTTRPNSRYNALGEANNAKPGDMICYIDADLYSELSRVKASLFNPEKLEEEGLRIVPLLAPWLGVTLEGKNILAAVGSVDFIRDYPTSDFSSSVPTDRGSIESRFMTTQVAICGYEPFCFLCGGNGGPGPEPGVETWTVGDITTTGDPSGLSLSLRGVAGTGTIGAIAEGGEYLTALGEVTDETGMWAYTVEVGFTIEGEQSMTASWTLGASNTSAALTAEEVAALAGKTVNVSIAYNEA